MGIGLTHRFVPGGMWGTPPEPPLLQSQCHPRSGGVTDTAPTLQVTSGVGNCPTRLRAASTLKPKTLQPHPSAPSAPPQPKSQCGRTASIPQPCSRGADPRRWGRGVPVHSVHTWLAGWLSHQQCHPLPSLNPFSGDSVFVTTARSCPGKGWTGHSSVLCDQNRALAVTKPPPPSSRDPE